MGVSKCYNFVTAAFSTERFLPSKRSIGVREINYTRQADLCNRLSY